MQDGTVLTARTDHGLTSKWARHQAGERWNQLSRGDRSQHVAEALTELRRIYQEGSQ